MLAGTLFFFRYLLLIGFLLHGVGGFVLRDLRLHFRSASLRRIGHLLEEVVMGTCTGLQRRPVALPREQRLLQRDDLIVENLDPALQIILRLQNRLVRIVRFQLFVAGPVEIAAIAFRVLVLEL